MNQKPIPYSLPINEETVHPDVAFHLRMLYDRAQNHFQAIQNQQAQIKALTDQVNTLKGAKP